MLQGPVDLDFLVGLLVQAARMARITACGSRWITARFPSGILSRCRKRSATCFRCAHTAGSHSPVSAALRGCSHRYIQLDIITTNEASAFSW